MSKIIKAKLVVEKLHQGLSERDVSKRLIISRNSVAAVRAAVAKQGLAYSSLLLLTEEEVYKKLFPEKQYSLLKYEEVGYEMVNKELKRNGVTLIDRSNLKSIIPTDIALNIRTLSSKN